MLLLGLKAGGPGSRPALGAPEAKGFWGVPYTALHPCASSLLSCSCQSPPLCLAFPLPSSFVFSPPSSFAGSWFSYFLISPAWNGPKPLPSLSPCDMLDWFHIPGFKPLRVRIWLAHLLVLSHMVAHGWVYRQAAHKWGAHTGVMWKGCGWKGGFLQQEQRVGTRIYRPRAQPIFLFTNFPNTILTWNSPAAYEAWLKINF